jgi:hypothetical protein
MRLEAEMRAGNPHAARVLELRRDSNRLLTTVLWGNVAVNCLLTLLSDSVMAGVSAFLFSTVGITLFGEIVPQAWFSRNALRVGSALAPIVRIYIFLLAPVAAPTAKILDWTLGPEGITYFRERDLREVIRMHVHAAETDLDVVEGTGALNFLTLDDLTVAQEGEPIDERSIVALPDGGRRFRLPEVAPSASDPFLQKVQASGKKWVILTDDRGEPHHVLDADGFLRAVFFGTGHLESYCHRPIIVRDARTELGRVLHQLRVEPIDDADDVIDHDMILLWADDRRVITGADLLGRLLRGISLRDRQRA